EVADVVDGGQVVDEVQRDGALDQLARLLDFEEQVGLVGDEAGGVGGGVGPHEGGGQHQAEAGEKEAARRIQVHGGGTPEKPYSQSNLGCILIIPPGGAPGFNFYAPLHNTPPR